MNVVSKRTSYLLLLGVVLLVLIPLIFVHGQYGGTDDAGTNAVIAARPGYKPWFTPLWVPPSPEIESLLFAVQAAIGAGIIGYVIGRIHGATRAREQLKKNTPDNVAYDTSAHLNRWRKKSLVEKATLAFGMLLIAVIVPSWQSALLVAALMTIATLVGARVPFSLWWQTMTAPAGFLLVSVLTLMFQVQLWSISIAPHGPELAARVGVRALAGLTCLLFLALTTPAADLIGGLRRLGVPTEITEMTLLMYRFVFMLTDTVSTMNSAQAARLGHTTYRRHMNSLSLLIANLMPRALSRARALEVGLAARGWHGELRVLSPVRPVSSFGLATILGLEAAVLLFGLYTR